MMLLDQSSYFRGFSWWICKLTPFALVDSSKCTIAWIWHVLGGTKLSSWDSTQAKWISLEWILFLGLVSRWISKTRQFSWLDIDLFMIPPFDSKSAGIIWVSPYLGSFSSCMVLMLTSGPLHHHHHQPIIIGDLHHHHHYHHPRVYIKWWIFRFLK